MTTALEDVTAERARQIAEEKFDSAHDTQHKEGELILASIAYLLNLVREEDFAVATWPWAPEYWKPANYRRDLVKAAALVLAEIDRFDGALHESMKEEMK